VVRNTIDQRSIEFELVVVHVNLAPL
jgi:hypothetical protein